MPSLKLTTRCTCSENSLLASITWFHSFFIFVLIVFTLALPSFLFLYLISFFDFIPFFRLISRSGCAWLASALPLLRSICRQLSLNLFSIFLSWWLCFNSNLCSYNVLPKKQSLSSSFSLLIYSVDSRATKIEKRTLQSVFPFNIESPRHSLSVWRLICIQFPSINPTVFVDFAFSSYLELLLCLNI